MLNMTEGKPVGLLVRFSVPMLIGNVFQQLYNLADSVIVGRLVSSNALAAIGVSSSVTFLFFALCNGIASGGGIITAQHFGSGNESMVKKCITNTAIIMLFVPVMIGILAFIISKPILVMLRTPGEIMNESLSYFRIMCVGLLFVALYNYIASMLRSLGDSMTPLIFLIASSVLNVLLDLFLICVMKMGVEGAGIATVISQLISGVGCVIFALLKNPYFTLTAADFTVDRNLMSSVLKLGVPISLQFGLIAISCMALQRVVNNFGATAVAAFTATSRIEQIIHQPYQTLGTAISTYTGQNYGARKYDRIWTGYHHSLILMCIFSLAMLPLMQFGGSAIMNLFVDDEAVISMGAMALRISSAFYAVLGVIYVIRGVLTGLGDAFFALLNGIVEIIGRFTVPLFLTSIPMIGVWGIWWSVCVVWILSAFAAWLRYIYFRRRLFPVKSEYSE